MIWKRIVGILIGMLLILAARATHNRAGEITYRHLGGFQYEATIITYTKAESPADRPEVGINWGDGSTDTIPRINGNGQGELVAPDIKKNIYIGVHTYPGPSVYMLSFEDPNRNGGVVNIPNSVNIPFYVSTQLIINPFLGINNSVQLLNPPIDEACTGQIFIHNPGAYDPDGDSISYKIVPCLGENGNFIPGFNQPQASISFTLNPVTGDLIWDSPLPGGIGEYNVAFILEEWRNGFLIGYVTRDMQINVVPCQNQPPQINPIANICVDAGDTVQFTVQAIDTDSPVQLVTLSASGGPLLFTPPNNAEFAPLSLFGSVSQQFSWVTSCVHVRRQPYLVSFKAIDNGNPNLASFESVNIRVVAQGPDSISAQASGNQIEVNWSRSPCEQASAYAVYRRSGSFPFSPAQCQTGIPPEGDYVQIATVNGLNSLTYIDGQNGELNPGSNYCYRVVALFPDGAESYTSPEACAELDDNRPVITQVSVRKTSADSGAVYVEWSKPNEIDTIQWPGPYTYELYRSNGINGADFVLLAELNNINDTLFRDSLTNAPNTVNEGLNYKVVLKQTTQTIGVSPPSSSPFLSGNGQDEAVVLIWNYNVLWQVDSTVIYRKNFNSGTFEPIATRYTSKFTDLQLVNGINYCYKIETYGHFSAEGFNTPLRNMSQELCITPTDLTPPCAPILSLNSSCDSLLNALQWQLPYDTCNNDIKDFTVYFTTHPDSGYETLVQYDSGVLELAHFPGDFVAGCYVLVATDSAGNISKSDTLCADNCPEYELPNVFSPNGDGFNDTFRPFPYRFIEKIDLRIFNRWGQEVFATEDPAINWDGKSKGNGMQLTDGVYFYVGTVYEKKLMGLIARPLKGNVQIIGSENKAQE
jgi:gliding motility-associated-like protein